MQTAHAQDNQPSALRTPSQVTPIYRLLAYHPPETSHLSELDDALVIAQIASFTDPVQAQLFMRFHSSIELYGARIIRGDTTYYIIFIGLYEDDDTARWAHESFAEENPKYRQSNFHRVTLRELKPLLLR